MKNNSDPKMDGTSKQRIARLPGFNNNKGYNLEYCKTSLFVFLYNVLISV